MPLSDSTDKHSITEHFLLDFLIFLPPEILHLLLQIGIGDGFAYFSCDYLHTLEPGGNLGQVLDKSGGGY